MKVLQNWWNGIEHLTNSYILTVADRLDYESLREEWAQLKSYQNSKAKLTLKGDFIYLGKSTKPYSIAYPLFAMSQHIWQQKCNYPLVRVLDERGYMGASGTMIIDRTMQAHFNGCVSLIKVLYKNKVVSNTELSLFYARLNRFCKYNSKQLLILDRIKEEFKLEEVPRQFVWKAIGSASTNAKAIKNVISYLLKHDTLTVSQTTELLLEVRGLLQRLEGKKTNRLLPFFRKLDTLFLKHKHPMVRDLYLVCINQVVRLLIYHSLKNRETDCLEYLQILIDQKINLDINLAQKAVLEYSLKIDSATNTWDDLVQLTQYTKSNLPLINSWFGDLELNNWKKHALEHVNEVRIKAN